MSGNPYRVGDRVGWYSLFDEKHVVDGTVLAINLHKEYITVQWDDHPDFTNNHPFREKGLGRPKGHVGLENLLEGTIV